MLPYNDSDNRYLKDLDFRDIHLNKEPSFLIFHLTDIFTELIYIQSQKQQCKLYSWGGAFSTEAECLFCIAI